MSNTAPAIRDSLIADAKSLPDLIAAAEKADPDLAAQLTTKSVLASKTFWGTLVAMGVSWFVTKEGLGWDDNTCTIVDGVITMGVNAVMRRFTDPRVTGFFKAA